MQFINSLLTLNNR